LVVNCFSATKKIDDDEEGAVKVAPVPQSFKEEQYLVARIPVIMKHDDTDVLLKLLVLARTNLLAGGPRRMQFTYPSLIFAGLSLAKAVHQRERAVAAGAPNVTAPQFSTKKIFHFLIESITSLAASHPESAMRLFLQAAQAADDQALSAIAYEFVKEALLIYECEITDSRQQSGALTAFIGALLNCKNFAVEDYEALITKIAQYSNKLLKKPDQARMISLCSLLFFPPKVAGSDGGLLIYDYQTDSILVDYLLILLLLLQSRDTKIQRGC
jgi:vacuolar protein sorting-associated protein 35